MLKFLRSRKGFTLVELMVVCIIVAILAAVAVPMMGANKRRAYGSEAEAAMGMIRSALRTYAAENSAYPAAVGAWGTTNVLGISATDLNGTFFSSDCYTVAVTNTSVTTPAYAITCTWDSSLVAGAPQAAKVNTTGATTVLDQDGAWTRTGY